MHSSCLLERGFLSRKNLGAWRTESASGWTTERKRGARALLSEPNGAFMREAAREEVGQEAGQEKRPRRFSVVEASEVWFKELERSESPPSTRPQESSKGTPGAQGDCPRRPELSLSHKVPSTSHFLSFFLLFMLFS